MCILRLSLTIDSNAGAASSSAETRIDYLTASSSSSDLSSSSSSSSAAAAAASDSVGGVPPLPIPPHALQTHDGGKLTLYRRDVRHTQ
jgi:hypothetical protein